MRHGKVSRNIFSNQRETGTEKKNLAPSQPYLTLVRMKTNRTVKSVIFDKWYYNNVPLM